MALVSPESAEITSLSSSLASPRGILSPLITLPDQLSARPCAVSAQSRCRSFSAKSNSCLTQAQNPGASSTSFQPFHSSLAYALVRDFAYPSFDPLHHGPSEGVTSDASTPCTETRSQLYRLSDPTPPPYSHKTKSRLSGSWLTSSHKPLGDRDGPPWFEDDDVQSPVVTSHRKRPDERPDSLTAGYGHTVGPNYTLDDTERDENDGIRADSTITTSAKHDAIHHISTPVDAFGQKRDSHFATSLAGKSFHDVNPASPYHPLHSPVVNDGSDVDDSRYSRDYQFTIVSPDEEMHGKAVALFDFARESENELPLVEGQIILVSYRHGQGWLVAQDPKTGESGLVPEEYVRLLREIVGGINGLMNREIESEAAHVNTASPQLATTPAPATAGQSCKDPKEFYTPIVSTFSTSREDFKDPWPRDKIASPMICVPFMDLPRPCSQTLSSKSINDEIDPRSEEIKKRASSPTKLPS